MEQFFISLHEHFYRTEKRVRQRNVLRKFLLNREMATKTATKGIAKNFTEPKNGDSSYKRHINEINFPLGSRKFHRKCLKTDGNRLNCEK